MPIPPITPDRALRQAVLALSWGGRSDRPKMLAGRSHEVGVGEGSRV
jgi:hypothetical protein